MCGIYCSLSYSQATLPSETTLQYLKQRGPDSCLTVRRIVREQSRSVDCHLTFCSSVLSLRGDTITQQPLEDPLSDSVLCWNGEAWKFEGKNVLGSDAQIVFNLLLDAAKRRPADADTTCSGAASSLRRILTVMSRISGPFAFIFYDSRAQRIFFGRDILGRRALLTAVTRGGSMLVSSVRDPSHANIWEEVEADGLRVVKIDPAADSMDLARNNSESLKSLVCVPTHVPWSTRTSDGPCSDDLVSCSIFIGKLY